jgi:hypothetical protein
MGRSGHPMNLAHQDGAPRDGRLVNHRHCAGATPNGSSLFRRQADDETGTINEVNDRETEGLCKCQLSL